MSKQNILLTVAFGLFSFVAVSCGGSSAPRCSVDGDCQKYSNYCGGCYCTAYPQPAKCPNVVNCFVDPCMGKAAKCVNNSCSIQ